MQRLTAPPRDDLTDTQVQRLLVGSPGVVYDRGCEILDASLTVVEDISGDFAGGTVSHDANADIHGTCSLELARDIDYGTQLVRPYMTLTAEGVTARFNLGAFLLRKPQTDYGPSIPQNKVDGSDRLYLLNRPVGDAYNIDAGVDYLAALAQVFTDAGIDTGTVLIDSTAAGTVLPAAKAWPLLTDAAGAGPTTWLGIVNDLLAAIGYRGVWADQDGYLRCDPYLDPRTDRPVEFTFDFDGDESVIEPGRSAGQDFSTVPNVWIFLQQNLVDGSGNPVEPTEGAGQYTVRNTSDGDASIDARGGLEWVSVVQLDAADQASLVAQGDARAAADMRVVKTFTLKVAPFPVAGHFDVYTYADATTTGGSVKVQETAWTLDLGSATAIPASMDRTWEQL